MEALFSYSLRMYLDASFPEISDAIIIEDNVTLFDTPKPFVSLEYLGTTEEMLSAGRMSYEEIHRYQVGIYARSSYEIATLHSKLRELLRVPSGIPVYDIATGTATPGRFLVGIGEYTPMRSADPADETKSNYGYFTIEIDILRNAGEDTFTQ